MDDKMLASKPLVSIIIPVYKVQKYLPKCLESLILQTYKNIEIIVVDDGSTDNSLSICEQYAAKDSRIHISTQKNSGVTVARLNGFLHSHGELIMFVDADDFVSLNIIEHMLEVQKKYQVDMVSCQYYDVKNERVRTALVRPAPGYYDKNKIQQFLGENFLYDKRTGMAGMSGFLWSRLFKRSFVYDALKVGEGLIHSEDQIGIFKVLYSINSMYVMQEPLYYYVTREGQATSKYNAAYWTNFEVFFARIQEIDTENYLEKQLSDRVAIILKGLIKMELTNDKVSIFHRYVSIKKNFSNTLRSLGRNADTSAMGWKKRLQYCLLMHEDFLLYEILFYLNEVLKSFG